MPVAYGGPHRPNPLAAAGPLVRARRETEVGRGVAPGEVESDEAAPPLRVWIRFTAPWPRATPLAVVPRQPLSPSRNPSRLPSNRPLQNI